MPARGQFSLNRRTKPSNFSDVGQIRISSGISTKMRTTPVTLRAKRQLTCIAKGWRGLGRRIRYRQMMEKMMRREAWKMFAIPSAMQTSRVR